MATVASQYTPRARLTYLGLSAIVRRHLSSSQLRSSSDSHIRSDFANQPWTGVYEPGGPTEGPLGGASDIGAPRITPTILKQHLDQFVVGQERAKKTLATAVYNHYQRIQELQRRDEEEEEQLASEERRRMHHRHPVEGEKELKRFIEVPSLTKDFTEDEYPGQQQTTIHLPPNHSSQQRTIEQNKSASPPPLQDSSPLNIEKSNVLLLGPSGVGKTLMAKTLARVLEVPFSMSDCTPFTQAGYIGEDADVCVQRLLAAANYDVTRAERGIIVLDEIDKIATAKVSQGKDVGGQGVQESLLKIIEGTTLQIQAKQERNANSDRSRGYPTNSPLAGGSINQQSQGGGQKGDTYNVRTDNILFLCAGAFNGLHKMVLDRVSKGSIGFGAAVRASPGSDTSNHHETILEGEDELFEKHLPYYTPSASTSTKSSQLASKQKRKYNTLDLVEPQDLQKYGLIPELVGRIPITCALSSLGVSDLVKVLTEPRNSLLKQYQQLFALSSIEVRFTTAALHAIAATASKMSTGARGLRTVMERLLAEAMFETPGSGIKYVLVNEDVANKKAGAAYFGRGQQNAFRNMIASEEEVWEERKRAEEGNESEFEARARNNTRDGHAVSFQEYRTKATAAGFV
ncbi:Putative AAA+ ATPase domain, ATPase, AAA-type, core, Clp ATPase [Septoria linicola]|uniref:AAA+ ATPase domain, ATPase, AAA-type, core, Clp ATPase n=1 Tax=Septoria linicola TaxID=215465 RepID=A0A9Q9AH67_9PEZI|nr:putative AAA+ ATPase domain, ATPase, AAA-type, core, Clp ATPase [Septoria linicola]USW49339.1 Putative AAA+ ATPase domain, ATPase, AAA-type, core, Clp ATPase [Septoria linicola]